MTESLNRALIEAHSTEDGALIARAYLRAADSAESDGDTDRACFFLTHAWVFALETGEPLADGCRASLAGMGRV